MKKLTAKEMLRAARKRLNEHLSLRPATAEERAEIATLARDVADRLRAEAKELRAWPTNPSWEGGAAKCALLREAGLVSQRALKWEHRAKAWDAATDKTYQKTLDELQARVDYYSSLVEGGAK